MKELSIPDQIRNFDNKADWHHNRMLWAIAAGNNKSADTHKAMRDEHITERDNLLDLMAAK